MPFPDALLAPLSQRPGFDAEAFLAVHEAAVPPVSIRLNPLKPATAAYWQGAVAVPWTKFGYYLPERPHFAYDPYWHAGAYYVQEASSMCIEQAMVQHALSKEPMRVLDLCAAPGGKSTHLLSLLKPTDVLVSNEVIQPRAAILVENLTKWGASNAIVTQNDPRDFGALGALFDVLVTDSPCSGSGLFRKDPAAVNEWSEGAVKLCAQRQQRILADVWPALKPGGLLIYATCSYSAEEDEDITSFVCQELGADSLPLQLPEAWAIQNAWLGERLGFGYRFFPHLLQGEGFYLSVMRKTEGQVSNMKPFKPAHNTLPKNLDSVVKPWVNNPGDFEWYIREDQLYAMPADLYVLFNLLQRPLRVKKAGVKIGDLIKDDLVPAPDFALSHLPHPGLLSTSLSLAEALGFLRKENIPLTFEGKGWHLLRYKGCSLGWAKNIGTRYNNYFPKEWRLRT